MAAATSPTPSAHLTTGARIVALAVAAGVILASVLVATAPASADTLIDGPVDLGVADSYAVLGATTVTNAGPTTVSGDLGLSPGSSVTGFGGPPTEGSVSNGSIRDLADSGSAKTAAESAFGVAGGLSPRESGLEELSDLILRPGVYAGGEVILSDNGELTLDGSSTSVWVFQVSSTLTIGSGTRIVFTGGAGACNVFWRVGSSATIRTGAQFAGTVVARTAVTLNTGATIDGRLFALDATVTMDTNTITAPTGCPPAGSTYTSEASAITSDAPTDATTGTPYAFAITATGAPEPEYLVSDGELPVGLELDAETGILSGTPSEAGSSTFTITAETYTSDVDDSAEYELTVLAAAAVGGGGGGAGGSGGAGLPATGADPSAPIGVGALILLAGLGLILHRRATRRIG